ncbi:MAG: PIG-L family deacetylase, partial [Verrucomicrobia bacterium]|nr:PIG-L family deacetylase [Verrucomicrobiota bacterium]
IFTKGDTGYSSTAAKSAIVETRSLESAASKRILGLKDTINLGLETQGVEDTKKLYQECVRLIRLYRPQIIFSHYREDKHRDHRVISRITEEAWWKAQENVLVDLGGVWRAERFFFYEVFELFTRPSVIVDISAFLGKKLEAMKSQQSQLTVLPGILDHIEGLAKVRGAAAGFSLGEAFLESDFIPRRE